jgi:diguanylate cyclase (GGDEF)-like protein
LSGRLRLRDALERRIDGLPGGVVFAMALVATAAVGAADELNGPEVHLAPLYALATAFAAWFLGRGGGLALALAGALAGWGAEVATRPYAPAPGAQLMDVGMELGLLAGIAWLAASLRVRRRRETALARTDALTDLHNRRGFLDLAAREVARSARTGRPLTVALFDVDRFQEINDVRGHQAGDDVLRALAAGLRSSLRAVDACARLGGDEFAVLLPDTDAAAIDAVLDRLRLVAVQAAAENGAAITVSLGAATFERPPHSVDEMLRAAERILHQAKAGGRDGTRHERVVATSAVAF